MSILLCSFGARNTIIPCLNCQKIYLTEGSYKWADGKSISAFDATVVRVETNYGKTTPQQYATSPVKEHNALYSSKCDNSYPRVET